MSTDVYLDAAEFIIKQRIDYATGKLRCKSKAAREHAVKWVMSCDTGPGSFLKWARAAGADVTAIRLQVRL